AIRASVGFSDGVRAIEQADKTAVLRLDRRAVELVFRQVVGHLLDGHVRAKRARAGAHRLLDCRISALREIVGAKQAEDHAGSVDHHCGVPPRAANSLTHLADRLGQRACRDIAAADRPGAWPGRVLTLSRKTRRQPIELTRRVKLDFSEAEALEPARAP